MAKPKRIVDTAISMLVHNRVRDTIKCLESLERADMSRAQLYVLDNGSSDGSQHFLTYLSNTDFANVYKKRVSEGNLGVNEGRRVVGEWIKEDQAKNKHLRYIVIMDSDVIVLKRDWLDNAKAYLDKHANVGMVGAAGSDILPDFSRFVPAFRNPVHSIAGFCQVWKVDVWKKLVHDPNFKKFWAEDSDACFQAQDMGYECHMVEIPVEHRSGHSGYAEEDGLWASNMNYLKSKWEGRGVLKWNRQ